MRKRGRRRDPPARRARHVSWSPCRPGPRSTSPTCRAAAHRSACTTRPPARSARPRRGRRPSCTSADHPLRRHPPRARRDLPGLRPGQPVLARRWATTCTTSRTSPTSTTRCSSAPPATRTTGWCSACARPRCSARTWRRCGSLPPRHYIGAVEAMGEIAELVGKLLAEGAAYRVDDPQYPDVYFDIAATGHFGYESPLRRGDHDAGCPASAAATRTGPASATRWTALLWRMARDGEPSWAVIGAAARARPGWHVECAAIALNRLGRRSTCNGGGSRPDLPAPRVRRGPRRGAHRRRIPSRGTTCTPG